MTERNKASPDFKMIRMPSIAELEIVPPHILKSWHQQWRHAGAARVIEALNEPLNVFDMKRPGYAANPLLWEASPWGEHKPRAAQEWLDQHDEELDQQAAQTEAERRWAWWHSWINTFIALGALLVAIVALFVGE